MCPKLFMLTFNYECWRMTVGAGIERVVADERNPTRKNAHLPENLLAGFGLMVQRGECCTQKSLSLSAPYLILTFPSEVIFFFLNKIG